MSELPKVEGPVAVTGAGGYIASWVVKYLLEGGTRVHATVRDRKRKEKFGHLEALAEKAPGELVLFDADLMSPGSFDEAIAGCKTVFHMASPFFIEGIKDAKKELVDPALEGTRNVLASVERSPTVERVVLTASAAAIYGDATDLRKTKDHVFDESHWNESSTLEHNPYSYSKKVAEEEAWRLHDAQSRWKLVAMNPGFVTGPSLSKRTDSTSVETMKSMVSGRFRFGVPSLCFGAVDVRDVAEAHVRAAALPDAKGRYLLVNESITLLEMGRILRAEFGNQYPFPKKEVPKFVLYAVAPILGFTWAYVRENVGHPLRFDHTRSVEELGLKYRSTRSSLVDHLRQLQDMKLVG